MTQNGKRLYVGWKDVFGMSIDIDLTNNRDSISSQYQLKLN